MTDVRCGDSLILLRDVAACDLVVTDPPYAPGGKRKEWKVTGSVACVLYEAARRVTKGGTMIVLTASSARGIDMVRSAVESTLPLSRVLVWHKRFVRSRVAGPWQWDVVLALVFGRGAWGRPEASSCIQTERPTCKRALGGTGHPAEVPEEVARWLAAPFSPAVVLDPFCGSGSLLLPFSARGNGITVIGFDIEQRWADAAHERLMAAEGCDGITAV